MFRTTQSQNKGFSLVEVIVVVAIVGILASLVIPSYGRFAKRTQDSEAKLLLSGLYSAEKAFYAEYSAYHSSFSAIGFSPDSNVRFNVGFGDAGTGVPGVAQGFNTPLTLAQLGYINSLSYCSLIGVGGAPGATCNTIYNTSGTQPPPLDASFTVAPDDFNAGAITAVSSNLAANEVLTETTFASNFLNSVLVALERHALASGAGNSNSNPVIPAYAWHVNSRKEFQSLSCSIQVAQTLAVTTNGTNSTVRLHGARLAVNARGDMACERY